MSPKKVKGKTQGLPSAFPPTVDMAGGSNNRYDCKLEMRSELSSLPCLIIHMPKCLFRTVWFVFYSEVSADDVENSIMKALAQHTHQ